MLNKIKLLVIGLAIGILMADLGAQGPVVTPGLNYFRAIAGSTTQPPYTFLNDAQTGMYLLTAGRGGLVATKVAVVDWTTTRVNFYVPLLPNTSAVNVGSNTLPFGSGFFATAVSVGTGTATAASGAVRLPNAGKIAARNAAGTADITIGFIDSAGVVNIGDATGTGFKFGSGAVAPAASGTRYLCISTTGAVVSSAFACSGS